MSKPRLLLAEDHEMVAQGFKAMLSSDYEIVAIVKDGAQVAQAVYEHHPDILLLDLSLPNRLGTDILRDLNPKETGLRVVVVTMYVEHALMELALRLGALGFVPKDHSMEELRTAIEEVLAGRKYVSPEIRRHHQRGSSAARMGFLQLTPRHQQVVRMIGHGLSSEEIAIATSLSIWTVRFHRKAIRRVLGFHNDLEMYQYALLVLQGDVEEKEGEEPVQATS